MSLAGGREWLIVYTRLPRQRKKTKLEPPIDRVRVDYSWARKEHAWLLRSEGHTLRQIGARLGIGPQRVRQLIWTFGRRTSRALLHTRWQWQ